MESLKKKKDYFKKAKIKIGNFQWAKAHDMGTVGKACKGTNKQIRIWTIASTEFVWAQRSFFPSWAEWLSKLVMIWAQRLVQVQSSNFIEGRASRAHKLQFSIKTPF